MGLLSGRIVHILDVMATCPTCGSGVSPPVNFCPNCGTALRIRSPEEEFKLVTVVFCDVVGSTGLGRQLGVLLTQRIMDRYGETVRRVLGGAGGSVGKRHGDGFMAAFGIPELHEDDALRAVRAADELRAALGERPRRSAGTTAPTCGSASASTPATSWCTTPAPSRRRSPATP